MSSAKCCSFGLGLNVLTHWGPVTHICVGKLAIISSDNGLSSGRSQAIIWTNTAILLIGALWTNFSKIWIEIHIFPFKKMHFKMSSGYLRPCFAASMCLWHIATGIRESTSKVFCSPSCCLIRHLCLDDVIKWKHFPRYWPFVPWSGEVTGLGEFPTQRPVTRSFDVFFDLRLNKRLSKQWWGLLYETLSRPLWRHRNGHIPPGTKWLPFGRCCFQVH